MFHLHEKLQYYLYPAPVDMRKSFYTLSGVVINNMQQKVDDGDVFIFINRNQNIMKILHMEHAGLVIYHKKLEYGVFNLPTFNETITSQSISWADLMLFVSEVKITKKQLKRKR